MVYGSRRVLTTDRDRLVVRIKKDVIDMGAPQMRSAGVRRRPNKERKRTAASPGGDHRDATAPGDNEQLQDNLDALDLGTSTVQLPEQKKVCGRRQHSGRYTSRLPNPRLYPGVQHAERLRQPPLFKSRAKKQTNQRSCESPIRHKRRKIKARCLVPNPRLYQAPPNRPRFYPVPPLNPLPSWSPPSKLGPQETASQIALRLSQRTIIPFRQFLPPAAQQEPVRKRLGSSRAPSLREKTRPVKSRPKTERVTSLREKNRSAKSPREKNEPLKLRPKSVRREELLAESSLFDSPPPTIRHSILKNSSVLPSLDSVPYQNYTDLPKRYVPRSQHFKPGVHLESTSSSTIQAQRAYTPPTLAEPIAMASKPHSSVTPEDVSDGNDSLSSAPSEYLAEFLSAIMSREYAEALKYCRLILHYEPHNATARSFYPILRHKLGQDETAISKYSNNNEGKVPGNSNSESGSGSSAEGGQIVSRTTGSPDGAEDMDETSGDSDESDAADYLASLSLDSSAKSSRCESPVANGTDSGSEGLAEAAGVAAAELKTAAACWLADDNGNPSPHTRKHKKHHADDDVENDNAASGDHTLLLNDSSLRQLREQFACSIK